ncbi:MAG: alpha/beta fold hydrolase [Bacteriovoracaceae bacterium]|nr:alpha/beta fold hydrolase [Bacteriovoracaceae bacterium]
MLSEHKFITLKDGTEIHAEVKELGKPVWIISTHGIGEHLGRHKYIQDLFGFDFNICQYDLRGHGRSMGRRGYISDFGQYMEDLHEIIQFLKSKYKMERYALFGHSMGGLITCSYIQNYADKDFYPERTFVNAPPVGFPGALGELIKFSTKGMWRNIVKLPLTVTLGGLVDLNYLSHDPLVKENYTADDLNIMKLHTKLLFEMVKCSKETFSRPLRPETPMYVTIGDMDKIVNFEACDKYFKLVEKAVHYQTFDEAYHELHNEIEKFRKPYFEHLKKVFMEILYTE